MAQDGALGRHCQKQWNACTNFGKPFSKQAMVYKSSGDSLTIQSLDGRVKTITSAGVLFDPKEDDWGILEQENHKDTNKAWGKHQKVMQYSIDQGLSEACFSCKKVGIKSELKKVVVAHSLIS